MARAFPYFLQRAKGEVPREIVAQALPAHGEVTLDVPAGATSLIVSGANVARMTRGAPLGRAAGAASWAMNSGFAIT